MNTSQLPIVIVGAGHSGAKAAAALRKHGWGGGITLIGEEACPPYDRPPLSKAVLLGKKSSAECAFYAEPWYAKNGIDLLLGTPVARINRQRSRIVLADGREVAYWKLLLATGSTPNPLTVPGVELANIWPLRTPQHANEIAGVLSNGCRLVVIGAGVIGLEVAAAASERGCSVEVIEAAPLAMGRSLPPTVSSTIVAEHVQRGVSLRFGAQVAGFEGESTVQAVRLATGESIVCDAVVYGVGVRPNTELAAAAGLRVGNGIWTNGYLQTEDEAIFACGDVCLYDSQRYGQPLRMENWRNAEEQADTVARNVLGQMHVFDAVPWFWSNQFDFALQVAGLPALGIDTETQAIGSSKLFLSRARDGRLLGVSALGSIREIGGPIKEYRRQLAFAPPP
ncbi:FAD-dependent oxidoreductase [Pseudomonas aeruginosa]